MLDCWLQTFCVIYLKTLQVVIRNYFVFSNFFKLYPCDCVCFTRVLCARLTMSIACICYLLCDLNKRSHIVTHKKYIDFHLELLITNLRKIPFSVNFVVYRKMCQRKQRIFEIMSEAHSGFWSRYFQ